MTYPRTADLERELTPVVIREILAVREEQGLSLSYAIRTVAAEWWRDALAQGFSAHVADDAVRYVWRVGNELKASSRRGA
ncbi:hypothetical protein [Geodermatophilus sp. URMC 65]